MSKRILLTIVTSICILAAPMSAAAFPSFSGVDCSNGGSASSAVCQDKTNNDPVSGNGGVLLNITNIVAYAAGAAAILVIIVAGIRYITSGGDSNAISSAKNTLIGALIGLAIIFVAKTLITYVVNRL